MKTASVFLTLLALGGIVVATEDKSHPTATTDGWPTASATDAGLSPARLQAMQDAIQRGVFKKITSVLIARHGKLVYEAYFDDAGADGLRNTRSVTKTVTGMFVGIAIDAGLLSSVKAPALKYFADKGPWKNPDPRKDAITVEDLLTMSSCLDGDDDDENSPGNEERMYPTHDWIGFTLNLPVRDAAKGPPGGGRKFHYFTAGVTMLGGLLERATHESVPDFARKHLFGPLGIEKAHWQFSPSGLALTGGGLELRSRDLLKLGQLYAAGGLWDGKRVVSKSWVHASTQPHVRINDQMEYGYLWWLRTFTCGDRKFACYCMLGNGGNKVVVFPDSDLVVVLTSTNYNTRGMHQQTERLLTEYILASVAR